MRKVNNKLAELRALQKHTDKNLQYIIDEACRILGNPLILYDIDFKILAYAENVSNDASFWKPFLHHDTIKQEIQNTYVSEGISDLIVSSQKPVLLTNDKLIYDWIFGKIYDKSNMPIACVHVLSSNQSFLNDDLAAVDFLCKLLSNEMLKIPYYQDYAQKKLDTCVNMLIGGKIEDINEKLYIAGYVEMVYRGLKNNLFLAVADLSQCDPSPTQLTRYRDLFKRMRPAFKYSIYINHIIIIMSTDESTFHPKRILNRLNRLFEQDQIYVGISSRFENLFELSKYYDEGVKALNHGLKNTDGQQIFVYDREKEEAYNVN